MIRVNEIKVPIEVYNNKQELKNVVCKQLGIENTDLINLNIVKRSIDARNKNNIHYKFNFDLTVSGKAQKELLTNGKATLVEDEEICVSKVKTKKTVVVVGSGPAGLFSGLTLAEAGIKVVLLERGECIEDRIKTVDKLLSFGEFNNKSNIQFGEGGAGTFSDGKLNTGIKSPLINGILKSFYEFGAPEEILYDAKPHIGTDRLRRVVVNIREKIKSLGGEVLFNSTFMGFKQNDNNYKVFYQTNNTVQEIEADDIVLAVGYSARDTLRNLYKNGLGFKQKPFSVGYRIEHLQTDIDKSQYGKERGEYLPPADYKLFAHLPNGRTVYTFCMCPGGVVVPAMSDEGQIVTNGMSYHARDGKNANSAVLVSVDENDYGSSHPLAGMDYQENLEKTAYVKGEGKFICSTVGDFLKGETTIRLGKVIPTIKPEYKLGKCDELLPKELAESIKQGLVLLGKKLKGFDSAGAVLTGIETRSSAPFMIPRNLELETNIKNVYAVGEGAGMAGGIISSAVDGKKIALKIIDKYSRG